MKIINILVKVNNKKFNLVKLLEEINELGAAISQYLTRKKSKIYIAEEIADVQLRCDVICKHLNITNIVNEKRKQKEEELHIKYIKGNLGKKL